MVLIHPWLYREITQQREDDYGRDVVKSPIQGCQDGAQYMWETLGV